MRDTMLEKLKELGAKASDTGPHLLTEEATKNALVMPFIQALGYDVFDPRQVVPEFTADVGSKKGEKVDYALKVEEQVVILIECKKFGDPLDVSRAGQLLRYFHTVPGARVGILTNGLEYQFFSDLEKSNIMDQKPFVVLRLDQISEGVVSELEKLRLESFDLEGALSAASDLKYMREIRKALDEQIEEPDEVFVRYFFQRAVPNGQFRQGQREQFSILVKRALNQFIQDRVRAKLKSALDGNSNESPVTTPPMASDDPDSPANAPEKGEVKVVPDAAELEGIVTTPEELEGFRIVQAICCSHVDVERVTQRDQKTYFGVLLDNNNRKPICRLWFNRSQKYLGIFDEKKVETRIPIGSPTEIYKHADVLRDTVSRYLLDKEVTPEA